MPSYRYSLDQEDKILSQAREVLLHRWRAMSSEHRAFTSPATAVDYVTALIGCEPREKFVAVALNAQHAPLRGEVLFTGTIDGTSVYPRDVVKFALTHNAAAVLIAHNHPSGMLEPSGADIKLTERLKAALSTIDVRLLDHIIVGQPGEHMSFTARGLL